MQQINDIHIILFIPCSAKSPDFIETAQAGIRQTFKQSPCIPALSMFTISQTKTTRPSTPVLPTTLVRRIAEYKQKLNKGFTARYNVNELVWYERFTDIRKAMLPGKTC